MKVNGFMFHSLEYKRRGNSASFYAEMNIDNVINFKTILYFVANDTETFGVVVNV